MHPTQFDQGHILSQTPLPGIPIPENCTPDALIRILGPLGAEILCQGIENSLFVDPQDSRVSVPGPELLDHAPKITPDDRNISWTTWTADDILLRDRVLGRLWDMESYVRCFGMRTFDMPKRVSFDGPWTKLEPRTCSLTSFGPAAPGQIVLVCTGESKPSKLGFRTYDDQIVVPSAATIDGQKKGTGAAAFVNHLTR
jgi:methionyl-tRNA formyltransferase